MSFIIHTDLAAVYLENPFNKDKIYSEKDLAERITSLHYMLMCVELFFPYNKEFLQEKAKSEYTLEEIVDRPINLTISQVIEKFIKKDNHFRNSYINEDGMLMLIYTDDPEENIRYVQY